MFSSLLRKRKREEPEKAYDITHLYGDATKQLITESCVIKNGVIGPVPAIREREFTQPEIIRAMNSIKSYAAFVCTVLPDEWRDFLIDACTAWSCNVFSFYGWLKSYCADRSFSSPPMIPDLDLLYYFYSDAEFNAMTEWNWLMSRLWNAEQIELINKIPPSIPGP